MKMLAIATEYEYGDEDRLTLETRELLTDMPQGYLKIRGGLLRSHPSCIALVCDDVRRLRDWLTDWLEENKP